MSIINIDSFRDTMDLTINGQSYSVTLLTIHDYINRAVEQRLDRSQGIKEYFDSALALLRERSTIPQEVLETLTPKQIEALLVAMQGINPAMLEQNIETAGDGKK